MSISQSKWQGHWKIYHNEDGDDRYGKWDWSNGAL